MGEKVVLITGASRGFGAAAARELAQRGHIVVATMRNPARDGAAVRADQPGAIHIKRLDVTVPDDVSAVVTAVTEEFGRLDAVVNNAGYGLYGPVEELTEDEVRRVFDTNFLGQWRVCSAAVPHLRANGGGIIVNVSSLGARVVAPLTGMYSATKAAVEAMTECLRYEVDRFGIWVTMLEPGMYQSDWQTTSLALTESLVAGTSVYQKSAEQALEAFRAMARTRPGSGAVAMAIADLIELQQRPPLRLPVGDDAVRMTTARVQATDDEWETRMMTGPFFADVTPTRPADTAAFAGY